MYFEKLCERFSNLKEVEALALGGSRSTNLNDEKSDYDLYVYVTEIPAYEVRKEILLDTCKHLEMNCEYWEKEDDCVLKDDIPIDILYRNVNDFDNNLNNVVFKHNATNAYTTCMWNNLLNSKVLFDKDNKLTNLKEKYDVEYPEELKNNITKRGLELLSGKLCSYDEQILKSIKRGDAVSTNHRIAAFLETYFNIIFAINKLSHPGEKRQLLISLNACKILPRDYEDNINKLLDTKNHQYDVIENILFMMVKNLKEII